MGSRTRQKQFEDNVLLRDMVDKVEINPGARHKAATDAMYYGHGLTSISPWKIWKNSNNSDVEYLGPAYSIREYVEAHTVHESWGRDEFPLRGALWPK